MLIAAGAVLVILAFVGNVPLPEAVPGAQSSRILGSDGSMLATLHGEVNRSIVPLEAISENLRNAVVATEDRSFNDHSGISFRAIIRAAWANLRGREVLQGGSTITQQYVRNAFAEVGLERTLIRKLREAALAVKMERQFTKEEILASYLNTVYFGRGAYGAEAAARTYFKKPASELTVSESAYLAGVIRAPERFQPDRDPQAARRIRLAVVADLREAGYLDEAASKKAGADEPAFQFGASAEEGSRLGAYFVEWVKAKLNQEFGLSDAEIFGGGLEVHTTLDPRMQQAAEEAVASTLDRPEDPEAALVAVDTLGRVRAMVGGRVVNDIQRARGTNFADPQTGGGRSAGSAFKPFTLAAFVDEGMSVASRFTGPSVLEVPSRQCRDPQGRSWVVENFAERDWGVQSVTAATAQSINTVFAQMIDMVGPPRVAEIAAAAGIESPLTPVCSLTLGTSDVTPLEMARAYATFANRGRRPDLLFVTKIVAPNGRVVAEREIHHEAVMERNVADTVNHVLQSVISSGTARRQRLARPVAAKTGTSQDHVDAWFVGFTPQLSTAVWMGFPPNEEGEVPPMLNVRGIEVTGGTFPGEIWRKFMASVLEGVRPTGFASARLGGSRVAPSPTPCPTPVSTPLPSVFCVEPSPSPSPEDPPDQKKSPKPDDSPAPTPTPSPTTSPEP